MDDAVRIEVAIPAGLAKLFDEGELERLAPELIAIHAFHRGRLTTGRAAELLGISRRALLERLAAAGVVFFDPGEEEIRSEREAGTDASERAARRRRGRTPHEERGDNAARGS